MWTRRQLLSRGGLALLGSAGALALTNYNRAADDRKEDDDTLPDGQAAKGMITVKTDQAIDKGLAYLYSKRHARGSFGTNAYEGNVAVTSLAALAFMAAGHQPNRGAYGRAVTDALRFVLLQDKKSGRKGYLHNPEATPHGPMYGHGFGTLFLAEVSGMVHDKKLRNEVKEKLHEAVGVILQSQNGEGGWRYTPSSTDADLSVTVCQIMALRAARNAGVAVPKEKVDKCITYVLKCQDQRDGWFRYMAQGGGIGTSQSFARTAAGISALNSAGVYHQDARITTDGTEKDKETRKKRGEAVIKGLEFLKNNRPPAPGGRNAFGRPDMHYFYGHYYAVQAMWTAGGTYWTNWYPAIRDELIEAQRIEGCWVDQICAHYATAMACIVLQVPNNYLPILQK
jgi:hypothetical protein